MKKRKRKVVCISICLLVIFVSLNAYAFLFCRLTETIYFSARNVYSEDSHIFVYDPKTRETVEFQLSDYTDLGFATECTGGFYCIGRHKRTGKIYALKVVSSVVEQSVEIGEYPERVETYFDGILYSVSVRLMYVSFNTAEIQMITDTFSRTDNVSQLETNGDVAVYRDYGKFYLLNQNEKAPLEHEVFHNENNNQDIHICGFVSQDEILVQDENAEKYIYNIQTQKAKRKLLFFVDLSNSLGIVNNGRSFINSNYYEGPGAFNYNEVIDIRTGFRLPLFNGLNKNNYITYDLF